MKRPTFAFALALAATAVMALGAWGPLPIAPAPTITVQPKVTGVKTSTVTIPASMHAQGLAVPAVVFQPTWSLPVAKKPAMVVLHGSGGLFKTPAGASQTVCSPELEAQFVTWGNRLANLGYTVVMPSSYSARGFCDKHDDAARIPKTFDSDIEQVIARVYDDDAAARYLCARSEVDCNRLGVMGFSQGGTMAMLALHQNLDHAIATYRQNSASTVGFNIVDRKPASQPFKTGIAYYPGCGFDGLVPFSTSNTASIKDKYTLSAPLTIHHGSKDTLVEHCSVAHGPGTRQVQAEQTKTANLYSITVYSGVSHSFDLASATGVDAQARDTAVQVTLNKLSFQM